MQYLNSLLLWYTIDASCMFIINSLSVWICERVKREQSKPYVAYQTNVY